MRMICTKTSLLAIIYVYFQLLILSNCEVQKIAIIGCGIGGTSQAYYLANSLQNAEIHIFDENKSCGGRVKNMRIAQNYTAEMGAHFFIPQNEMIMNLINELNLTHHYYKRDDSSISFWDGKQIYFELGNWKLINLLRMFYRYGLTMLKAKVAMNEHLVKFIKFYTKLQSKGPGKKPKTFSSVKAMLKGMKLLSLVNNSTWSYLQTFGINENFVEEFFQSVIASIYNQDKNINAFAGFVTLCALLNEPHQITGGNNKLIRRLLEASKKILKERIKVFRNVVVFEIEKVVDSKQKYRLKFRRKDSKSSTDFSVLNYDYVIFAVPVSQSKIRFTNLSVLARNFEPSSYKKTVVSFIAGDVNYNIFNIKSSEEASSIILSNNPKNTIISELKVICKECYKLRGRSVNVYQIQLNNVLTSTELNILFQNYKIIHNQDWNYAYPNLIPSDPDDLPDFEIEENVFHINAIEKAASCMEMILISSKNIANIIQLRIDKDKDGKTNKKAKDKEGDEKKEKKKQKNEEKKEKKKEKKEKKKEKKREKKERKKEKKKEEF